MRIAGKEIGLGWTVNLGHVLTIISMAIAVGVSLVASSARFGSLEQNVADLAGKVTGERAQVETEIVQARNDEDQKIAVLDAERRADAERLERELANEIRRRDGTDTNILNSLTYIQTRIDMLLVNRGEPPPQPWPRAEPHQK
jgi:hypothetical protein